MAFIEDLDVFFDTDEFAVTAFFEDGAEMPVIFDRAHIEGLGFGQGIDATQPVVVARSVDIAVNQVQEGTVFRVPSFSQAGWHSQQLWGGGPFTVRRLVPDGTGLTVLELEGP